MVVQSPQPEHWNWCSSSSLSCGHQSIIPDWFFRLLALFFLLVNLIHSLTSMTVYMIMTPRLLSSGQNYLLGSSLVEATFISIALLGFWQIPLLPSQWISILSHSKAQPSNKSKPENKACSLPPASPSPATFTHHQPSAFSHHPLIILSPKSLSSLSTYIITSPVQVFISHKDYFDWTLSKSFHTLQLEWSFKNANLIMTFPVQEFHIVLSLRTKHPQPGLQGLYKLTSGDSASLIFPLIYLWALPHWPSISALHIVSGFFGPFSKEFFFLEFCSLPCCLPITFLKIFILDVISSLWTFSLKAFNHF